MELHGAVPPQAGGQQDERGNQTERAHGGGHTIEGEFVEMGGFKRVAECEEQAEGQDYPDRRDDSAEHPSIPPAHAAGGQPETECERGQGDEQGSQNPEPARQIANRRELQIVFAGVDGVFRNHSLESGRGPIGACELGAFETESLIEATQIAAQGKQERIISRQRAGFQR